jgi:MFS family permease
VDRAAVQRRTLRVLVVGQLLAGAGLAAGITVGALIAEDLLGSTELSGISAGLFTLGSAGAAVLVGRLSARRGRRPGLVLGYTAGACGAAGVVVATVLESVPLLLLGLLVYGAGSSTNLQARYAGGDLAEPASRATAISTVLFATTFGAVAGPNLLGPTGQVAVTLGLPRLSGPFLVAVLAYGLAGLVLAIWLRPDPLLAATAEPVEQPVATSKEAPVQARLLHGAATMVLTQLVMVAVMTMTPVHMHTHHHGLGATGLVIAVHIAGMFLPSPLTGRLIDRVGTRPVVVAAVSCLLGTGLVVAVAPPSSVTSLAVALALLGLGWNLGLLAGTTMVAAATDPAGRAVVQGRLDAAVALAGATGGLSSGMVMSATSYATLAIGGGVLALALLPVVAGVRPRTTAA